MKTEADYVLVGEATGLLIPKELLKFKARVVSFLKGRQEPSATLTAVQPDETIGQATQTKLKQSKKARHEVIEVQPAAHTYSNATVKAAKECTSVTVEKVFFFDLTTNPVNSIAPTCPISGTIYEAYMAENLIEKNFKVSFPPTVTVDVAK